MPGVWVCAGFSSLITGIIIDDRFRLWGCDIIPDTSRVRLGEASFGGER